MQKQNHPAPAAEKHGKTARRSLCAIASAALLALALQAQTTPKNPQQPPPAPPAAQQQPDQQQPQQGQQPNSQPGDQQGEQKQAKPETHITPEQAKDLFASIDQILQFASNDTKLPIKHDVKRRLTTRAEVEKYLVDKMKDDKDAQRMERSEIVLKKFGLIDADFQLRPFLVKLLDEQIAGYYDSKTKTVNLLDWIEPDQQKPVMAHELTHALQDQRVDLEKWENQTPEDVSHNYADDKKHIAADEDDTAREAVLEGQAMAVFVDYSLAPAHRSLRSAPQLIDNIVDNMTDDGDSPVLSRAPLLLQESLLFPYKDGLKFEAALISDDKDPSGAFGSVLDRPPDSSYEIMNPRFYELKTKVPVLNMPDIHPVIDAHYNPYDIGVMGELDVRILAQLFGGPESAAELTPAWDGGIYYAAQKKDAPDKSSTSSVALLYLSQWKSPLAAADFVRMYANELNRKYTRVVRDPEAESSSDEQVYNTNEGPVLIVTSGKDVFVSESFDLATAHKLQLLMLGAQQSSGSQVASLRLPLSRPAQAQAAHPVLGNDLTGNLVHFMGSCGMMKIALPH